MHLKIPGAIWLTVATLAALAPLGQVQAGSPLPAPPDLGEPTTAPIPELGQVANAGRAAAGLTPQRLASTIEAARRRNAIALRGKASPSRLDGAGNAVVLVVTPERLGSGTIIDASGTILTSWELVRGQAAAGIIFRPDSDTQRLRESDAVAGRIIAADRRNDLALISIKGLPANTRPIAIAPGKPKAGTAVDVIGHPYGEIWSLTTGTIRRIRSGHTWTGNSGTRHRATIIEVETQVMTGNLGGAVLDGSGALAGMEVHGDGSYPITGLAVAAPDIRRFLDARPVELIPGAARARKACEPVRLATRRTRSGDGTGHVLDLNCNGKPDAWLVIPDLATQPITLTSDANENGFTDSVYTDANRDGRFDEVRFDTNEDGTVDLIGRDLDDNLLPGRMEAPGN